MKISPVAGIVQICTRLVSSLTCHFACVVAYLGVVGKERRWRQEGNGFTLVEHLYACVNMCRTMVGNAKTYHSL